MFTNAQTFAGSLATAAASPSTSRTPTTPAAPSARTTSTARTGRQGLYLDQSGNPVLPQRSPRKTDLHLPSLTLDYDLGFVDIKSITSYVYDETSGRVQGQTGIRTPVGGGIATNAGYVGANGAPVPGGFGVAPLTFPGFPTLFSEFQYINYRRSLTQEVRLSSPSENRFSWVAGVYYNNAAQRQPGDQVSNENAVSYYLRGVDEAWPLGMPNLTGSIFNMGTSGVARIPYTLVGAPTVVGGVPTYNAVQTSPNLIGDVVSRRYAVLDEEEIAAFAEANYRFTEKLKGTLGLRASRVTTQYTQIQAGPVFGAPLTVFSPTPQHPFPDAPGDQYLNIGSGELTEKPVNPKVGLTYQATSDDMFYATVARGYRPGSVNPPGTLAQCAPDVAALGQPTPLTYKSDSVWSYEGGAKLRLFNNRVQLNTSAFYIDWKDPQLTVSLRCAFSYVTNAGKAVSQGADLQAQIRAWGGLTLNVAAAYTDAHYAEDFSFATPGGGTTFIVKKGGSLGVPKWQYNIGAQYNFDVFGDNGAYVRADYQYSGKYQRGAAEGTLGYDPVTVAGEATHFVTARAGMTIDRVEASLFVNNLFNSKDRLNLAHSQASPLVTASTFRPREIGVQLAYRY